MAKLPSEISNRQVIQLLRTSGSSEHVSAVLSGSAASGEIAIQLPEEASATSLWTLAKDGETAVQFVNKEQVDDMIKHGAVEEVDKIEAAVGLTSGGTYIKKTGTHYLNDATTVEGEIGALDRALNGVQAQINGMNADSVADDNKIVSDVTQSNGQITASVKNVTDVKLSGYTVGGDEKVAATDTLGQALGKLQGQINGMDKDESAAAGQVVTTISQADGKVSETKANVKDLQLGGYVKTDATGAIAGTDTINAALSKLENKANAITISNNDKSINVASSATGTDINVNIKSDEKVIRKDGKGGLYTNLSLVKISESLPTTVKERYELRDSYGVKIGESIDIAKDSHIVSITYITDSGDAHYQNLEYKYIDASGNTQTVYVDMSSLVLETEFKSGVTATDGIVHGVVDSASEKFLTVGADGFKLSGVQNAIDAEKDRAKSAENALDSVVGSVKDASSESRTYRHDSTNYLNGNTTIKADVESIDSLLGKVESEPASSADTVFSTTNTVAKNISDIKKDLAAFKNKLTLSGKTNAYAKVTVVTAENGTTIEVSAKTQSIATSTKAEEGLADAYDVKTFAIKDVKQTSEATSSGVKVEAQSDGSKLLDFSGLKIDCGEF